jgi:hypothetical protein
MRYQNIPPPRGLELGSSVRKFVRIALVVCLAVTAVPVALFASLWLWTWYKTTQVDSFYRENRLLGEMHAGQKDSTNDPAPAREALLKVVPLGTDREADHVARMTLHKRCDIAVPGPADQVALPMARHGAIFNRCRSFSDGHGILYLAELVSFQAGVLGRIAAFGPK